MKFWLKRLSHPVRGLRYAFAHDFAVRFETIFLGIIGIPGAYLIFGPFSVREMLLLLFSWFFIVVNELHNSAIETALDEIHPKRNDAIGRSKDLASAAVVWAGVFGLITFVFVVTGAI